MKQEIPVTCLNCSEKWIGLRALTEETGPRMAEVLNVTKNKGSWEPRWDMLETRSDSSFRQLRNLTFKPKKIIKSPAPKEKIPPKCPKCGSPMRLINPRKGDKWKAFWGCTKYRINGCNGAREV